MREIKFRVWDPNNDYMHQNINAMRINLFDYSGDNITEQDGLHIMQYTGLKDGEERDIYEGDIAIHDGKSGSLVSKPYGIPIKYGNGETFIFSYIKCGLVARHISSFGDSMYDTPNCIIKGWEAIDAYQLWNLHRGFKILGNIYENPELLEIALAPPSDSISLTK